METDISKGGENWGHISVDRRSKGIEIWARLDPKLEELIASASDGQGSYKQGIESFGRLWVGMEPTPNLQAYSLTTPLDSPSFTLNALCGPLIDPKGKVNLSFLTLVGIGSTNGVRFMISGPAQAEYVKNYGSRVVKEVTNFLREYLVPVHIGINISVSNSF